MNFGLRKMQISSAAVPRSECGPSSASRRMIWAPLAPPLAQIHCLPALLVTLAARVRLAFSLEHLSHALQPDAARALHEHRIAARNRPSSSSPAASASGTECVSPPNAAAISAACGPTVTSISTPRALA